MEIFSVDRDGVVDAAVSLGRVNYKYALEKLYPLVDRLAIQRNVQNPKFYDRLQRDILRRCLMPPITVAFVVEDPKALSASAAVFQKYVDENISEGFILDGIQRLHTLRRAKQESPDAFPEDQALFLNVILCSSVDNLLYRMITLNNGQKPMSARHQVEILTSNAFTFDDGALNFTTEKDKARLRPGLFKRADFELAYMAFLSNSIAIDSQKLIQEKLDELLASKILNRDPAEDGLEFTAVIDLIGKLIKEKRADTWFRVNNNLIGFAASIRNSFAVVNGLKPEDFAEFIDEFEEAFRSFDVSKIKLGRARRQAVSYVISRFDELGGADAQDITERLVEAID